MNYISSKENILFKKIKKLKQKKYREEYGLFLIEGIKVFDFAPNYEYVIIKESKKELYDKFNKNETSLILSDNLFLEISSQENSQGIMFCVKNLVEEIDLNSRELVILDNIQDPGNLGTLIRVIDAVGIKNVILTKGSCDIYNEKVVRSTMGSLFNLNFKYLSLLELKDFLKEHSFNILVTALSEKSINYDKMTIEENNAIIFGNEGHGVSQELLDIANEQLIIPIYGKAESLNVSIAAGIFLYKYRELKSL